MKGKWAILCSVYCTCSLKLVWNGASIGHLFFGGGRFGGASENLSGMSHYVLHPLRLSSVVHHRTREYCRPSCSDVTSWIAFCWYDKLRSITDTYEVRRRAILYAGPAVWNLLPDNLRRTPTINSFKRKLKTYLFISAFSWFYFSFSYYVFWHLHCTDVLIFVTGAL